MARNLATTDRVERDELLDFIRDRHHFVLITHRVSGEPQVSPVTGGVDAAGRLVVATYPTRAKVKNARRDSRGTICVLSDNFEGAYVQVDGTFEVLDIPEAVEPLVDYFRAIAGEHSDWDEYREAMRKQGKSLLRLTIESWGPIATGGFPPELAD